MSVTCHFQHYRPHGTFIYACPTSDSQAYYVIGHEFALPPHANENIAVYTSSQSNPIFIGQLSRILYQWDDCIDIQVIPSSTYHTPNTPPFVLRIPEYWFGFSSKQWLQRKMYLVLCRPPSRLHYLFDSHPTYFASPRDTVSPCPQLGAVSQLPGYVNLVPIYLYGSHSSL